MTCRATIEVGGETVECGRSHADDLGWGEPIHGADVPDEIGPEAQPTTVWITWRDGAPGASPHVDPAPTYRVDRDAEHWIVRRDGRLSAWFDGSGDHPDPEGAAKAEAARLNGEPDDHALLTLDRDGMERALLGERASRVQAEVNLVDAEARAERFRRQRNEAQDAYSQLYEALEEIGAGRFDGLTARFYACRVLREVGP